MGRPFIDLTGKRFGTLVVRERLASAKGGQARWLCICDCGNKHDVVGQSLRRDETRRCPMCAKRGFRPDTTGQVAVAIYCTEFGQTGGLVVARDMDTDQIVACSTWARKPLKGDATTYAPLRGVFHQLVRRGRAPAKESGESWERWRRRAKVVFVGTSGSPTRMFTPRPVLDDLVLECEAAGLLRRLSDVDHGEGDDRRAAYQTV